MNAIKIRRATVNDLIELQRIGRETFSETFSASNSEVQMKAYLDSGFSDNQLKAELMNAGSEFYFATLDQQIIAYLKVNYGDAQTELKDHKALEIERIYVLQAFHGKQAGSLLLDKALQIAEHKNLDYVWLGVWTENQKALRFYTQNGFVAFDRHLFKLGDEEQTDLMLKRVLKPEDGI